MFQQRVPTKSKARVRYCVETDMSVVWAGYSMRRGEAGPHATWPPKSKFSCLAFPHRGSQGFALGCQARP